MRSQRLSLTLFVLIFASLAGQHIQSTRGAQSQQPGTVRINDRFSPAEPNAVRLEGLLGKRVVKNAQNWLAAINESEILSPFLQRPGKDPRAGEFAGKWIQAATIAWLYTNDAALRSKLDRVVSTIISTQRPDGYLGTYADNAHFGSGQNEHWDLTVHRSILLGLLTYSTHAADPKSLEASRRAADLLVVTFGPQSTNDLNRVDAHQGLSAGVLIEPIVLLYRLTADERYLAFARFIVDHWEAEKGPRLLSYLAANRSVREIGDASADEMLSCLVGLCELYRVTGEIRYLAPATSAWKDIVEHQLMITGGGSNDGHWREPDTYRTGEEDKPASTCVTVAWMQLNLQLLRITGDEKYAEELEKSAFNQLAAAQRPDGAAWAEIASFDNPRRYSPAVTPCSSSGALGIAMLPTFAYMVSDDNGVVVNFFAPGNANLRLRDGTVISIRQETGYPSDGDIKLTVTVPRPVQFALLVRVPSWSSITHRGAPLKATLGSYWKLRQTWSRSLTIPLDVAMNSRVLSGKGSTAGRIALARGPQILTLDERANPSVDLRDLDKITVSLNAPRTRALSNVTDADGMPVYEAEGIVTSDTERLRAGATLPVRFIPFSSAGASGGRYFVWLNRPSITQ